MKPQRTQRNDREKAACTQNACLGLVRTFKMCEKPLEVRMEVAARPDLSGTPLQNLPGFELSAGKTK